MKIGRAWFVTLLMLSTAVAFKAVAQQADPTVQSADPTAGEAMDLRAVIALLRQQQQELAAQRELLESQSQKIATLTRELDGLRKQPATVRQNEVADPAANTAPAPLPEPVLATAPQAPKSTQQTATEAGKSVARAQSDDPSRDSLKDFTGAWRLPGTDAALAIGGFVKTDVVYNFDPLQIADRFIVGSIPVGAGEPTGDEAQSKSRLNYTRALTVFFSKCSCVNTVGRFYQSLG